MEDDGTRTGNENWEFGQPLPTLSGLPRAAAADRMPSMASPASAPAASSYEIQGRTVAMPVVVRDASAGVASYLVPAAAAQRLIPGDAFRVAEILPGRTLLGIGAIDYRDNDLGDYNEVSIVLFVRPRGEPGGVPYLGSIVDMVRGKLGTFIYKLPVNQSFTCEAGCTIWGFPKSVEEIDIDYTADSCTCRLAMGGEHVLTLTLPRAGKRAMPETEIVTYTYIDGVPHRTRATQSGSGFGIRLGGAQLTLGSHPLAQELRSLGLPKRALMTMWTEKMRAVFQKAEAVAR